MLQSHIVHIKMNKKKTNIMEFFVKSDGGGVINLFFCAVAYNSAVGVISPMSNPSICHFIS